MDKMFAIAGSLVISLGIGFYTAGQIIPNLHNAYLLGGLFWMAVGAGVTGFGLKVNRRQHVTDLNNKAIR